MTLKVKEICTIGFKHRIGYAKDLQRIKCMESMTMIVFEFQFYKEIKKQNFKKSEGNKFS